MYFRQQRESDQYVNPDVLPLAGLEVVHVFMRTDEVVCNRFGHRQFRYFQGRKIGISPAL